VYISIRILVAAFTLFGLSCGPISATDAKSGEITDPKAQDRKSETLDEMARSGFLGPKFSEWFVSPVGSPKGDGTESSPVDIATALSGEFAKIKPGDVIWLRGGHYKGPVTSRIQGLRGNPIHVRQFPGERAVLDKGVSSRESGTIDVRGNDVWFWDFEVANSSPDRRRLDSDLETNPMRGSGINIYAANTKYINLTVRDNGHGFGLWNEEGGTEIYGCLVFNNGNNKKEHGIYGHNKAGTHLIRDNVIFNNAGYGLHLYANSTKSSVSGFTIEGNTVFNNGALMLEDQVADQILVGGVKGVPAERVSLSSNYVFNELDAPTSKNRGVRLGYEDTFNKDVKLIDNYIVSKVPLRILWWQTVEVRGNTIYSAGKNVEIREPVSQPTRYIWESNVYLSRANQKPDFLLNGANVTFADWTAERRMDRNTRLVPIDTEDAVFVRPNKYERGRGVVAVFNWKRSSEIQIDLSSILRKGERYEIRDVQDPFGNPVAKGIFGFGSVTLPLTSKNVVVPIGKVERVPAHTGIEFGAFLVEKKSGK